MQYKDYYAVLGVDKNADEKAIRKAYRRLARKHHPDINPNDPAAEERFKEINEAQEVLLDSEKRKLYDRFGAQWEQYQRAGVDPNSADWQQFRNRGAQSGGYRNVSPEEYEELFGQNGGYSSFFEDLFGGRGAAAGGQPRSRPGRDIEHSLKISLEEAFHGTTRTLQYEDGRAIDAKIPPGVDSGSRVRIRGQGGQGSGGGAAGDLYLLIEVEAHGRIERNGDDLNVALAVDLFTLLLGGKQAVSGIDKTVKLTIPAGTENGKIFRLRGLGMPKLRQPQERGDLYATVTASLPANLSEEEKRLLVEWQALRQG